MKLRNRLNGSLVTLETVAPLGRGGEAQVYPVLELPYMVAKIYAPGKATTERAQKLVVMMANPPEAPRSGDDHVPLAWPHSLLTRLDDANAVVGFLMPRAHAVAQVIDYYNPQRRLELCPLFDYRYLLRTARNLAATTRTVHARGYVIGDLKHSNVLVSQTALVTLVDTDSFQVRDPQTGRIYPCQVGTPDYTPPERQQDHAPTVPLTPEHDLFALGVLIFQLLMEGTHPFAGVYTGEGDPPPFEERIAAGHFPYSANPGPYRPGRRTAPPFEMLPPSLQTQFLRCFEVGHTDPTARPDAHTWQTTLDAVCRTLAPCADNPHHFYSAHLSACPWCERRDTQLRGLDSFPTVPPRKEPIPQAVLPTPEPLRPALTTPTYSPGPLPARTGGGLTLGWVGLACALIFGLSTMVNQYHGNPYPQGTIEFSNISPSNETPSSATPLVRSTHYWAMYNQAAGLITLMRAGDAHFIAQFGYPSQKFRSMQFSPDEKTLVITSTDNTSVRWNIAQQKFQ
jgi:DNA-binding helix-hairpin-helix protein with protein kinase domain